MIKIDGLFHCLGSEVGFDGAADAGGIDNDGGWFVLESVSGKNEVVTIWCKRHGFIRAVSAELEDVVFHDDGTVGGTWFVQGEIKLGELTGLRRLVGDTAAVHVRFVLGGVVDEDVASHDEAHGLVDPGTTSAVAEGVAGHGNISAAFLDANDTAAMGAIDEVASDGRVFTKLGQKERTHAAAEDMVVREDNISALLNVHRVTKRAELAASDAHVFGTSDVKGSFAWTAARRGISGEVGGLNIVGQMTFPIILEANRSSSGFLSDLDVRRRGFDNEVLKPTNEVLRQVIAHAGKRLTWLII